MRAWLFQDYRQKQKLGDKCPWSVGWIDPEGKRKAKTIGAKSYAEKFQRKKEGELAAGTYQQESRKTWTQFRAELKLKLLPRLSEPNKRITCECLDKFERIVKPIRLTSIKTQTIDQYVAERLKERGRKPGSKVAPATINKELRHLKAVLRIAYDWGYLPKLPKFRKERESELIGPVISPEHFEVIYNACDVATKPERLAFEPAVWWRALLVFAICTGWRVSEILALRRDNLDSATGAIKTRAGDNKGHRDDLDYLPEIALQHLQLLIGFHPVVFFWPHAREELWQEFHKIQRVGGIHLSCSRDSNHECTPSCHLYGFHALRRAYATLNADRMPAPVLQKKMRHRSFTTTLRYIQLADKMKKTSEVVYVPEFLSARQG